MRVLLAVRVLALPALALAFGGGAAAQAPVVLADGRMETPTADVSAWPTHPALRQATEAARTYWRGQDAGYEEDVRFFDAAEGAFTEPGARQHAVLFFMSPWPRCCPKMGLAVVEADRLVYHAAFEGVAQTLAAVPDLDGDGRDELVATGAFGMGGQTSTSLTVMSFGADGLRDWGSAPIHDSACAARPDAGASRAARILAVPGPTFTVERYVQPTCEATAWEADGDAEPLALGAPSDVRYVVLPLGGGVAVGAASGAERREQGRLAHGDQTLTSGEYVDEYAVACRRGQPLVLDLRSTDFDPYLILALPGGEQLDNDDYEGDQTRSLIEATPAQDGECRVLVTSYAAGETGAYVLTIRGGN